MKLLNFEDKIGEGLAFHLPHDVHPAWPSEVAAGGEFQAADIETVEVQKVEGEHDGVSGRQLPSPAAQRVLQHAKVRSPLLVKYDCFTVQNCGADAESLGRILDASKAVRPVVPRVRMRVCLLFRCTAIRYPSHLTS